MKPIHEELQNHLASTPGTLGGAIRYSRSRFFARQLVGYLLEGRSIDEFLDDFPGIERESAEAVQAWMRRRIMREFDAARAARSFESSCCLLSEAPAAS